MSLSRQFEYARAFGDGSSENYAYVDGGKPIVALLREVDITSIDERYIEIKPF